MILKQKTATSCKTPECNSCLLFQSLNIKTVIKAANGKSVEAKTVFSRSIKFLKEEALKVICQRTGDDHYNANDIQWVLTVPAIWSPKAKQFMREAAYEVRVDKCESLFIVQIINKSTSLAIEAQMRFKCRCI